MNNLTDQQLLSDYAGRRSEAAFAELVRRHVDFVYSAALRMVRDTHLAEDVTQGVFVAFAQHARQLTDRPILSGWLHRTAQNLAANAVRSDVRRRAREQEAATMNELLSSASDASWEHIAPQLDDALGELSEPDRDAVMLRYFEKKSAQEMAERLGISAEAAQKRVGRAVERLREFFSKRNVTIGASGLVVIISANAVQAAPVGLAAAISAAAVLAGTAVSTSTVIAAAKTIAMTTLQKTILAVTVAVLAGAGIYEAHQTAQLREQNQTLQQRQVPLAEQLQQLQQERDDARNRLASFQDDKNQQRLRMEHLELLSLRGRVSQLADELRRQKAGPSTDAGSNLKTEPTNADSILFSASLTNRVSNGQTLVLGGWSKNGMRGYLLVTPTIQNGDVSSDAQPLSIQSRVIGAPESFWNQIGWLEAKSDTRRSTLAIVLTSDQAETLLNALKGTQDATISNTTLTKRGDGQYLGIGYSRTEDNGESGLLMGIDLIPRITPDGQAVNLEVRPAATPTNTLVHPLLK